MKKAAIVALVLIVLGLYLVFKTPKAPEGMPVTPPVTSTDTTTPPGGMETGQVPAADKTQTVLGQSVEGRNITAYHFGTGEKELLFAGGLHGGYEWNTVLVAYELVDYLKANPTAVPANLKVTVIPVVNPDGLHKVTGKDGRFMAVDVTSDRDDVIAGRFNANKVDLNRNFDCDWKKEGKWQTNTVSGGTAAFSEPESLAVKNYVEAHKPAGAVVWYSSAGGVFASNCHNGVTPETTKLLNAFGLASKYPAHQDFNFYEITGDMVNWLAKNSIPAISVLLTTHDDVEWDKNKAGILAVLKLYAE